MAKRLQRPELLGHRAFRGCVLLPRLPPDRPNKEAY